MPESAVLGGGVWYRGGLVPGGVSGPRGVSGLGGSGPGGSGVVPGGCLVLGGEGVSAGQESPPPVNRMTNRCKNITLAKTSFRPVIIV